jgi:hypothetical protein
MTSPYEPPLSSDYLFVKLMVRKEQEKTFRDKMGTVQDTVFRDQLRWRLVRAGKRLGPALPKDETGKISDETHFEFLHLWQADNPINLWQGQVIVAQDTDYAALYEGVDHEEQDILRLPPVYCPTAAFAARAMPFLLVQEVKMVADWSRALDWQWKLPVPVGSDGVAPEGFSLSFAFQTATGALRSHLHFFESETYTPRTLRSGAGGVSLEGLDQPRDPSVDRLTQPRAFAIERAGRSKIERELPTLYERVEYEHKPTVR